MKSLQLPSLQFLLVGGADRQAIQFSFLVSLMIQGLTVISGVLLARELGPTLRGVLATAILWPTLFAALTNLGVSQALSVWAADDQHEVSALIVSALVLSLAQASIVIIFGLIFIPSLLSDKGYDTSRYSLYYLAFAPIHFATVNTIAILNGRNRLLSFQALRLLVVASSSFGILALFLSGQLSIPHVIAVYLISYLITLLATLAFLWRLCETRFVTSWRLLKDLSLFGVKSHVFGVTGILNERVDQLAISALLTPTQLGLYVVAGTLTSATMLIGTSVSVVAVPLVARRVTAADKERIASRLSAVTFWGSLLISAIVILLTPFLIRLFFGEAYSGATMSARILLVATVALGTNRVLGSILMAMMQPLRAGYAEMGALVVTAVGLLLLLEPLGISGAALTSLLAYSVSLYLMTRWLARDFGCSQLRFLAPQFPSPKNSHAGLPSPGE